MEKGKGKKGNKMRNRIFLIECAVILLLLGVIGFLLFDKKDPGSMEVAVAKETEEGFLEENFFFWKEDSVSENSALSQNHLVTVSENNVASVSENAETEEAAADAGSDENGNTGTEIAAEGIPLNTKDVIERNKKTQIVVFGDSIWNAGRGTDGISEQIMEEKDVVIYNCSIGGTTAAVYNESTNWETWTSNSFNGMMYITNGLISEDQLIPNDTAAAVFKEIDFEQVDYIIVSYGLNDYFSNVPIFPKEYFDLTSYVGALRHGIHKIQKQYPHIEFILTSPTYCGWFEGERDFGLGNYVEAARGVSAEYETHFLDMYHALGKNPQEKTQYLEDGVHLTEEGRSLYARAVIDFLTANGIQ